MSFIKKIFSIKKTEMFHIITIFGIKFKFMSNRQIFKNINKLCYMNQPNSCSGIVRFIWENEGKLTTKQIKRFLENMMYEELRYFPNLDNPKTFNEKLNWMKLNYSNPLENKCIDKYEFKNYVKEKLGDGYTIPIINVYDNVNDIDFDSLPDKFVIKQTLEGSGSGVQIIKDKSKINKDKLKYKFNNLLQEWNSVYYYCFSRGYKDIVPRIIIEEYMEEVSGQLYDYKFFCFHGKPKLMYVAIDHFPGVKSKISLYDLNNNELDIHYNGHPNIKRVIKPKNMDKMLELAKILSKDFPFVRVDFYEVGDKVYVGEMTFTPGGGFGKYKPDKWDYKMGKWLDLSKLEKNYLIKEE